MGFGSGIRDPGSGKNLFRIPDPGVKKAPDPGSATLPKTMMIQATPEFETLILSLADEEPGSSSGSGSRLY